MTTLLRPALVLFVLSSLLTGLVYPLAVTGLAQALFSHEANGSLVTRDGRVVGSELIGQPFDQPGYFWSRPSATGPVAYNAGASSGSNQGPMSEALRDAVTARVAALREAGGSEDSPVPADLVTASGSGLDPHVSPAAALYQVPRVARARGVAEERVRALVEEHVEPATLGVLGAPRVDVLALNLALDETFGALDETSGPAPAENGEE